MQHADSWSPIAAAVGERYPVRLLDLETWTFEERLEEIRSASEGVVLAGYSMGGRLALHAATRGSFAGVATVGASAGIEHADERRRRKAEDDELAAWIETHAIGDIVERWEQNPVFASQTAELVHAQRPGRLDHEPPALARLLRSAGQGALEPIWSKLAAVQTPILAIAGEHDAAYVAAAKRIAASAPRAQASVVEGAGHAAHLEQPDAVAHLLREWLEL